MRVCVGVGVCVCACVGVSLSDAVLACVGACRSLSLRCSQSALLLLPAPLTLHSVCTVCLPPHCTLLCQSIHPPQKGPYCPS